MFHRQVRTTFKTSPVAGLSGGIKNALTPTTANDSLGSFLDYLYGLLEDYSFALVRGNNFSLVNITSVKQSFSVGYSEVDTSALDLPSGVVLTLTFSFVARPPKQLKVLEGSRPIRLVSQDYIWGKRVGIYDYLTVSIPFNKAETLGLDYSTLKHLTYLYNTVGLCTKSFVQHPRGWYNSTVYENKSNTTLQSLYLTKAPGILLRDVPAGYWIYNRHFWQDYNHLIVPRFIDSKFFKYFIVNLLPVVPPTLYGYSFDWLYKANLKGGLMEFIQSGLRKFITSMHGTIGNVQDDDLYSVAYLINGLIEPGSFGTTEEYDDCSAFLQNLSDTLANNPRSKALFLRMFSDIPKVAKSLLLGDEQLASVIGDVTVPIGVLDHA